jgi:signal transduction histidine kinase
VSQSIDLDQLQASKLSASGTGWRWLLRQTRTRILLLYLLFMVLLTAAATPMFRWLLFNSIDQRVRQDLAEEMMSFQKAYLTWEDAPEQSVSDLKLFISDFLAAELPEDDNFFIAVIEGKFYQSSPAVLVEPLRPNSELVADWSNASQPRSGERESRDPGIGKVIYLLQPLMIDGRLKGVFVAAHTTAGERYEALIGIYIFTGLATGVLLLSFVIAWLATGRMFLPVQQLAHTASSIISESDLNQRIQQRSGSNELSQLIDVFNQMMDRIQKAFDTQRDFINDAGHELRTPITIMQGHLELMSDVTAEQQETIDVVMDELDRMNRFVNDLIMLAKAERADFLQMGSIDAAAFVDDFFSKASSLADRKWYLVNRCSDNFMGDRQRLMGALLNLAQNATQHTQANDLIEIGAVSDSQVIRFWVRDTGAGISLDDQKKIFDRFARAANSYRRSEGVGLGLAIVKAIVTAHGGKIELVSQLGAGSTFTLIVPQEPPILKHQPIPPENTAAPNADLPVDVK